MTDNTNLSLIDQLPELVANQADRKSLKKRIRKADQIDPDMKYFKIIMLSEKNIYQKKI
jgi:hypothetical protein